MLTPTPGETLLLRAVLWNGEAADRAWSEWTRVAGDPRQFFHHETSGIKRLLPLMAEALLRRGVPLDREFRSVLLAARAHEELRARALRRLCVRTVTAFAGADIAVIALKGAALSESAYPDWSLRHTHDLDFLLRAEDIGRAVQALIEHVQLRPEPAAALRGSVAMKDRFGAQVMLHARLFRVPYFRPPADEVWRTARAAAVAGVPCRVLDPAYALLHVLGQAACGCGRANLQWVCDAWRLLERQEPDWDVLANAARESGLALPTWLLLRYLRDELRAPVAERALDRLETPARGAGTLELQAALHGARGGARGRYRDLLRSSGSIRARWTVLRWMLFPSPRHLRGAGRAGSPTEILAFYLLRPLRVLSRLKALFVLQNDGGLRRQHPEGETFDDV